MTTLPSERVVLTEAQRHWLTRADVHLYVCPGPGRASSCVALVRRGLLFKVDLGTYRITEAGRLALKESSSG